MRILFISFFLLVLTSSVSSHQIGTYKKRGNDFTYTLTLNVDSTFNLQQKYFEVDAGCKGRWQVVSKKLLLLRCSNATLEERLQSGYINQIDIPVQIRRNGKLKIERVVLVKE